MTYNKVRFYFAYIVCKLFMFREVKKGSRGLYIAEGIWLLSKFVNIERIAKRHKYLSYVETKFGKFHINPDLLTNIAASPAYERLDINYLIKCIKEDAKLNRSILFIDVGAYFGLYTIAVANNLKHYNRINYIAFEPGSDYLSAPTFSLLKKNLQVNKVKRVTTYKVGLGDKKTSKTSHFDIPTIRLDSLLPKLKLKKYDKVFMKIDVDGYENKVLLGAKKFITTANDITLVVEDFVDPRIVSSLKKEFRFTKKLTPYNSFWEKR